MLYKSLLVLDRSVTIKSDFSREIAIKFARLADKKKAENIVILNLKKLSFLTDYFIVLSGKNKKQNQAIAQELIKKAEGIGATNFGLEGYKESDWILVDFGSVVVHIFSEALREFYNLEFLWADASKVRWKK